MTSHGSRTRRRIALLIGSFISLSGPLAGQDAGMSWGAVPVDETWSLTTRWDYRVRRDGRYLGHADRELREVYRRVGEDAGGIRVAGSARLLGETRSNGRPVAARLEDERSVNVLMTSRGRILEAEGPYPRLRGFPTFPDDPVEVGEGWEAPLEIVLSGPEGRWGLLHQIAAYTYVGSGRHRGREAHFVDVGWAVRYRPGDPLIDGFLAGLDGAHRVRLVVDAETGAPVMARDHLTETWRWADGSVEEREGFALMFWDGVAPLDGGTIRRDIRDTLPGIRVDETPRGLKITLDELHFEADTAVILESDRPMLDRIADVLRDIPERTILIRGHTADVGRPDDQDALSGERARRVAEALIQRGIPPARLAFEGVGADEPVADNATEAGRRLNRRVELFILED